MMTVIMAYNEPCNRRYYPEPTGPLDIKQLTESTELGFIPLKGGKVVEIDRNVYQRVKDSYLFGCVAYGTACQGHVLTCMRTRVNAYVHVHTHAYASMHVHTCTHMHTHAHAHAHAHTHTALKG